MADILTSVTAATNSLSLLSGAASSLSNLIVASPATTVGYQPQNPVSTSNGFSLQNLLNLNPSALLFHYEGEQSISLESDITDHYIEDNSAVQDQIALRPVIITTHGFIGELHNVPPPILQVVQSITQKLGALNPFFPGISTTATNAYNTAFQVYQAANSFVNSASSAWSSLTGTGESVIGPNGIKLSPNQNLQQTMFQQLYGYWTKRTLFTVQTPWAVFQNMAILKCRPVQSEETNVITDFEVTFKQIRVASTLSTVPKVLSNVLANQAAAATLSGTVSTSASTDALTKATSVF